MPPMSPRLFIPISLGVFVVFVGGAWLYLSATEKARTVATSAGRLDVLQDPGFVELAERTPPARRLNPSNAAPPSPVAPPRQEQRSPSARRPSTTPGELLTQLARRMDDAAVDVRNDAADTYLWHFSRGVNASRKGDVESAIAHFDRALKIEADGAAALAAKASALARLGRFLEARDVYEQLLRTGPVDPDARYNYAVVLFRLSEFLESARQLRLVVRERPDHADAHYNLASLAQREGRINEARDSLEIFTRLRPDVASAWFNLGVLYVDFDLPLEAAHAFEAVTTITPADADAWLNLAIARAVAGQYRAALEALRSADEVSPCDETIVRYLATVHDILADQNTPDASQHRRIAAMLQEQVDASLVTP